MSRDNRKLPGLPSKASEKQALAEKRMAAKADQEDATGYAGHGLVALDISPAPPFIAEASPLQQAKTAKLIEDITTAKMITRHRIRCAALQQRRAGRPFDWGRLLVTLGVIDTPFLQNGAALFPKHRKPRAKPRIKERDKHYDKIALTLVEQVKNALGCTEETAKDILRQTRLILGGWKIALPGRRRGKWVPYPAPRFKNGSFEKNK